MVLSGVGGRYRVDTVRGVLEATVRGRVKRGAERVLVGDRVVLAAGPGGSATIEGIEPRRSVLRRRSPGRSRGTRIVAANVDQVLVVGAARDPVWDPYLIDRFTAVAEANDLAATIVVNKTDLDPDAERHAESYRSAGYDVVCTCALDGRGCAELAARLSGKTSLFSGPTGVGKSSLLNAVCPGLRLRTGAVSRRSRGGRHTTVSAEMHRIGDGAYVVDTPGLRDVGLWGLEPRDVARAFPEFRVHAASCRFDDCRHLREPGCAVVDAVARGEVGGGRHASYQRLLEEAERALRPWT